jgi:membrane-associated protease RseP (regulator of RpoE activity)
MQRTIFLTMAAFTLLAASTAFGQSVISQLEQRQPPGPTRPSTAADATAPVNGYLGAVLDDEGEQGRGVRVKSVKPGTPAEKSGLKADDLITAIDGKSIINLDAYDEVTKGRLPQAKLKMTVERNGRPLPLDVVLGVPPASPADTDTHPGEAAAPILAPPATSPSTASPPPRSPATSAPSSPGSPTLPALGTPEPAPSSGSRLPLPALPPPPGETAPGSSLTTPSTVSGGGASLGITVDSFVDRGGPSSVPVRRGAIITRVHPGSPAETAGLKLGAVIVRIDSRQVDSADDLVAAIRAARPGQEVELTFFDGDRIDRKNVRLGSASASVAPSAPSTLAAPRSSTSPGYGAPPGSGSPLADGGFLPGGGASRPLLQRIERAAERFGPPTGSTVYDPLAMAALQARVVEMHSTIKALEERIRALESKAGITPPSSPTSSAFPTAPGFGSPAGSSPTTAPGFGPAGTVP